MLPCWSRCELMQQCYHSFIFLGSCFVSMMSNKGRINDALFTVFVQTELKRDKYSLIFKASFILLIRWIVRHLQYANALWPAVETSQHELPQLTERGSESNHKIWQLSLFVSEVSGSLSVLTQPNRILLTMYSSDTPFRYIPFIQVIRYHFSQQPCSTNVRTPATLSQSKILPCMPDGR